MGKRQTELPGTPKIPDVPGAPPAVEDINVEGTVIVLLTPAPAVTAEFNFPRCNNSRRVFV